MTGVKVVDASAVGALLFGEPEADRVEERLVGAQLLAPTLLPYEIANVAAKKIRRHPEMRESLTAAHGLFAGMAVTLVSVDHQAVAALAWTNNLTAYDAGYLWLAIAAGAELVTLDKALERASAMTR